MKNKKISTVLFVLGALCLILTGELANANCPPLGPISTSLAAIGCFVTVFIFLHNEK